MVYIVGIVDAGLVEDQGIGDARDPQQLVPVGVVRGSPILPVFAVMKSLSIIAFIRWRASLCASIGVTG
ncbi:MAG: hypothetical protein OXC28_09995, partial [Defluviicoccus sp.]|nr:hypothetical protein [Defluviicoccus sp.]